MKYGSGAQPGTRSSNFLAYQQQHNSRTEQLYTPKSAMQVK